MNDFNKNFVKDFRERTSNFKEFDKQMGKIHQLKCELESSTKETVNFLNESVMATATSSLIQTAIVLEPKADDNSYRRDDCNEFITFNHKGMGTIRVQKPGTNGYSYGTNKSETVNTNEFLYIVSDDVIRQSLISDMINTKKTKLLKHFNDMCSAKDELITLNKISEQYQKDCKGLIASLSEPQEIFFIEHKSDGDDAYETKLTKFTVTGIQIDDADNMRLKTQEVVEEEPSYNNGYGKRCGLRLSTRDIETAMIFMQFPVELKQALDDMQHSIQADHDKVMALKHSIEEKLATYSVLKSLM